MQLGCGLKGEMRVNQTEKAIPESSGAGPRTPWSWQPATPWVCPRCGLVGVTAKAGPRCQRCGYVESPT